MIVEWPVSVHVFRAGDRSFNSLSDARLDCRRARCRGLKQTRFALRRPQRRERYPASERYQVLFIRTKKLSTRRCLRQLHQTVASLRNPHVTRTASILARQIGIIRSVADPDESSSRWRRRTNKLVGRVALRSFDGAGVSFFSGWRASRTSTSQEAGKAADARSSEPNLPNLGLGYENHRLLIRAARVPEGPALSFPVVQCLEAFPLAVKRKGCATVMDASSSTNVARVTAVTHVSSFRYSLIPASTMVPARSELLHCGEYGKNK
jgi:hypothetical protein